MQNAALNEQAAAARQMFSEAAVAMSSMSAAMSATQMQRCGRGGSGETLLQAARRAREQLKQECLEEHSGSIEQDETEEDAGISFV